MYEGVSCQSQRSIVNNIVQEIVKKRKHTSDHIKAVDLCFFFATERQTARVIILKQ